MTLQRSFDVQFYVRTRRCNVIDIDVDQWKVTISPLCGEALCIHQLMILKLTRRTESVPDSEFMQFGLLHPGECCEESTQSETSSKPNTVVRIDFYDKGFVLTPIRKDLHVQSLNCVWLHLGEVVNSYYEPEMKYCMIQFKDASEAAFAEECFCNEKVLLDLLNAVVEPCAGTDYEVLVVGVLENYLLGSTFIALASLDPLWVFTNA